MLVCFEYFIFCAAVAESRKSSLSKRVSELEGACRVKEAERVDLELQLTQVQENLKKSLAGGVLGASVEAKPPLKVTVVAKSDMFILPAEVFTHSLRCLLAQASRKKTQNIYSETLPVNCATELRRRPPSVYASTGTVMQKAKVLSPLRLPAM